MTNPLSTREKRKAYGRQYYHKNRLKLLEKGREYRRNFYHRNKRRLLAYQNAYYKDQDTTQYLNSKPRPITFKRIVKPIIITFD